MYDVKNSENTSNALEKKVVLTENYKLFMIFINDRAGLLFTALDKPAEDEIIKVKITKEMLEELERIYIGVVKAFFPEREDDVYFKNKENVIGSEVCTDKNDKALWLRTSGGEDVFQQYHISVSNHAGTEDEYNKHVGFRVITDNSEAISFKEMKINHEIFVDAMKKFIFFTEHGKKVRIKDGFIQGERYCCINYIITDINPALKCLDDRIADAQKMIQGLER